MFVYIRSAAFVIVVTQKLFLQQSKNGTATVYGNPNAPSLYLLGLNNQKILYFGIQIRAFNHIINFSISFQY